MNMLHITLTHYLILGAILLVLGIGGLLIRRNYITVMMSLELIFAAAAINFAAFDYFLLHDHYLGQAVVTFIIVVAAGEAAIGLAILIALFRHRHSGNVDDARELQG
jgi:NADH-quinone oxidoreductase subunit K